jgi:glycosyltransferase involved in cell wall biosynthesis
VVDKVNLLAIQSLLARSLLPREDWPGLVIPDHRLTDDELLALHRDADCFVTATRSEGFGLPIFEAAVMGKPIISPGWGGHGEFLKDYPQWRRVWYAMTPVFPGEDEVSIEGNALRVAITLPTGANARQVWAEPSLDRLALEMRMVVQDFREGRLHDRHDHRPRFDKTYGFDAIGARFINTLKETLR